MTHANKIKAVRKGEETPQQFMDSINEIGRLLSEFEEQFGTAVYEASRSLRNGRKKEEKELSDALFALQAKEGQQSDAIDYRNQFTGSFIVMLKNLDEGDTKSTALLSGAREVWQKQIHKELNAISEALDALPATPQGYDISGQLGRAHDAIGTLREGLLKLQKSQKESGKRELF